MGNTTITWNTFKKVVEEKLAAAGETGESAINYIDISWDAYNKGIDVFITKGGGSFSVSS